VSGTDGSCSWLDPHTPTGYGHYEHLECLKTVWQLRDEISFASVEKILATTLSSWLYEMVIFLTKPRLADVQDSWALLIIYINIVRGAKRLWGESSMGRNVRGAKSPDTMTVVRIGTLLRIRVVLRSFRFQ